jgi:hypothetical protein
MSKKDYINLSNALRSVKPVLNTTDCPIFIEWLKCCQQIAVACQRDNARFDRKRFMMACGLQDTLA